jgi:NitT/TauT family transport system substrate-binding protein
VVCYGAQFVTTRADVGRRFMQAHLQGERDYNDALKDGRIAGPNAEEAFIKTLGLVKSNIAVADIVDMSLARAAAAALGPYKGRAVAEVRQYRIL